MLAVSRADHLRWKFIENPQGKTTGIHLYRNGELVGRMAALARKFHYQDRTFTAAHIVDFLIHPRERSMPTLMQLVLGLKQLSGYDFQLIMAPNPAGAAVWEKFVKMRGYFDLTTAVVPLQPAAILEATGKLRTGKLGKMVDWPLRYIASGTAWLGSFTGWMHIDTEWPEAAELDHLLTSDWGDRVVGSRSAKFLEWRYRRSPVFRYNVLFLREDGKLKGYLVTRRTTYNGLDCLFVVDAFGAPTVGPSAWRAALLREIKRASVGGAEIALLLGNMEWGPMSMLGGFPFIKVPANLLPRKTTVYAEWITNTGFEIRPETFYCALGDSDVI